jgi:hypothetical protein
MQVERRGHAIFTQEIAVIEKIGKSDRLKRVPAPSTDSRPHPRIADQLAAKKSYYV